MKTFATFLLAISTISFLLFSCKGDKQNQKAQQVLAQEKKAEKSAQKEESPRLEFDSKELESQFTSGVFGIQEVEVQSSPDGLVTIDFEKGERVIDYDVSPAGRLLGAVVKEQNLYSLTIWDFHINQIQTKIALPDSLIPKSATFHPNARSIFILGKTGPNNSIYRLDLKGEEWQLTPIYSTQRKLRRLVVGPRPFVLEYDYEANKNYYGYRLFLGEEYKEDSFRIISITEHGKKFYQVLGPEETRTSLGEYDEYPPSDNYAEWMLPLSFHPAGHELICQDNNGEYHVLRYSRFWYNMEKMDLNIKSGTITSTPNGLGFIHWQKDKSGIGVYLISERSETRQLSEFEFIWTPSSVPDGKGIVGLSSKSGIYTLTYAPIEMPLNDVVNAWMFVRDKTDQQLFMKNHGLFRANHSDQMYKLYESENYHCNGYDSNSPTRPYLVTTDIFWELFGAAFQGIFIVKERDEAIPAFWQMIDKGNTHLSTSPSSQWKPVFQALSDLKNDSLSNPEVHRILRQKFEFSDQLDKEYDYGSLKPMGHYSANEETKKYFRAFRYFNTVFNDQPTLLTELNGFPEEFQLAAKSWIESYQGFIAPSNSFSTFEQIKNDHPLYCQFPSDDPSIFPLSWGFDNEILNSTIYHSDYPTDLQVTGPEGHRLQPKGLDLAAATGNQFAKNLLMADFEKYPQLKKIINNLSAIYDDSKGTADFQNNIYNQWINAIVTQWSELEADSGKEIWQTKRLQTGLATWATLRHATVLVNETVAAECGEGGFEELLMRAPRGYVEPDTATFESVAVLFDYTKSFVRELRENLSSDQTASATLYAGIEKRLEEAAKEAREFKAMAEKELKRIALSDEENEKILYVARVAEHLFLVFNSIGNEALGLAAPDPIAKIANVSGGRNGIPYLMAAVGNAMEWDQIVPFYGRKQIVKGAIYSYYEFESSQLLNDKEWNDKVEQEETLPWIKPFISGKELYGMPSTQF